MLEATLERVSQAGTVTWAMILDNWDAIRADLMQVYGIVDYEAHKYQWPWWRAIVVSLLEVPTSRVYRRLINK